MHPWVLITSLEAPRAEAIAKIYRSRMTIEECFRDTKNHRFGWSFEDARSRCLKRIEVLLLIASLGYLIVISVGWQAERAGLHHSFQANTTKHRRVLSLFVLGCALLATPPPALSLPMNIGSLRQIITDWTADFEGIR